MCPLLLSAKDVDTSTGNRLDYNQLRCVIMYMYGALYVICTMFYFLKIVHGMLSPVSSRVLVSCNYFLLSIVYCLLSTLFDSTVYCLLSTVYCLRLYCLLSTVYFLLSTVYCLLSTVNCLSTVSSRVRVSCTCLV